MDTEYTEVFNFQGIREVDDRGTPLARFILSSDDLYEMLSLCC